MALLTTTNGGESWPVGSNVKASSKSNRRTLFTQSKQDKFDKDLRRSQTLSPHPFVTSGMACHTK
jgi:hypothetical protein